MNEKWDFIGKLLSKDIKPWLYTLNTIFAKTNEQYSFSSLIPWKIIFLFKIILSVITYLNPFYYSSTFCKFFFSKTSWFVFRFKSADGSRTNVWGPKSFLIPMEIFIHPFKSHPYIFSQWLLETKNRKRIVFHFFLLLKNSCVPRREKYSRILMIGYLNLLWFYQYFFLMKLSE